MVNDERKINNLINDFRDMGWELKITSDDGNRWSKFEFMHLVYNCEEYSIEKIRDNYYTVKIPFRSPVSGNTSMYKRNMTSLVGAIDFLQLHANIRQERGRGTRSDRACL